MTYRLEKKVPLALERTFFDEVDDWLKVDRFVFIGWSGLLLLVR